MGELEFSCGEGEIMEWDDSVVTIAEGKMSFEEIYNRYYLSVYLYLFKRLQHQQDAEDLTNDVFVACYKNFWRYDPERASLATWIFVIASNRLKNYYRAQKNVASLDDMEGDEPAAVDDLEHAVLLEEARGMIREALRNLSEQQRKIVLMRYFNGMNSTEIGAKMGLTSGNVRVLLSRILAKLKTYLENNHFEWDA